MFGKKIKIRSGAIATLGSFHALHIFLLHMFLPAMWWGKRLHGVTSDSQRLHVRPSVTATRR